MGDALDDAGLAHDPRTPAAAALVHDLEAAIRGAHAVAIGNGVAHPEVDLRVLWRRLLPAAGASAAARAAVSYECRSNPVWPMPGAARVIAALQAHTPVGVVSNAQFFTPLVLAALLPRVRLDPKLMVWSVRAGGGEALDTAVHTRRGAHGATPRPPAGAAPDGRQRPAQRHPGGAPGGACGAPCSPATRARCACAAMTPPAPGCSPSWCSRSCRSFPRR